MFQQGLLCQGLTHETRATGDDGLSLAQSFTDSLHQRTTHRVAQQQATRQHCRHQNDSEGYKTVESSVVFSALYYERLYHNLNVNLNP